MDQNQDDLYDEDQFYRESEAIPPAPKLHRELATSDMPTSLGEPSSSVNPPLRSRDSNQLEGKNAFIFIHTKTLVLASRSKCSQCESLSALDIRLLWAPYLYMQQYIDVANKQL